MANKNYKMKKTISMKKFIEEFGENFPDHMKERLLELEIRCVLTRKDESNILDIKHVEHTQHDVVNEKTSAIKKKEFVFGQFIVNEGTLYFSQKCAENDAVVQSPIVETIYNSLSSQDMLTDLECIAKKIDPSNIDYVIDTMLTVFPEVSQRYTDILKEMMSHQR